jgi:hypothetical protein
MLLALLAIIAGLLAQVAFNVHAGGLSQSGAVVGTQVAADQQGKVTTDWWQAALVGVGVLQFFGLIGGIAVYWIQARIMSQSFGWTHRPRIRVKHVWLTSDIWHGEALQVSVVIVNTGSALATIDECHFGTLILPRGRELPAVPRDDGGPRSLSMDTIDSGITVEISGVTNNLVLTEEEHAGIRSGERILYCFGRIIYRPTNATGNHTTAFCMNLELRPRASVDDRGRFCSHYDPDYAYQD